MGKSAGSEIYHGLRQARRTVSVVSPYLTSSLVRELLASRSRGLSVTLVTTDADVLGKKDVAAQLVRQERHVDERAARRRRLGRRWSLAIGFLAIAGAIVGGPSVGLRLGLLLFAAPMALLAFLYFHALRVSSYTYHFTLRLKVVVSPFRAGASGEAPLVHPKAYVIDEVAYLGSLNFTTQGSSTISRRA